MFLELCSLVHCSALLSNIQQLHFTQNPIVSLPLPSINGSRRRRICSLQFTTYQMYCIVLY